MIFAKLVTINYAKPWEIRAAIAKEIESEQESRELDYRHSEWVDFHRFGYALGISPARLRLGFTDNLGFPKICTDRYDGIRHCPECLLHGYHCVLFDLPFVSHCPWHGCQLADPCETCMRAVLRQGLKEIKTSERIPSPIAEGQISTPNNVATTVILGTSCGHLRFYSSSIPCTDMLPMEQKGKIISKCVELIRWWAGLHPQRSTRSLLFSSLIQPAKIWKTFDSHRLSMSLGLAQRLGGKPPWPINLCPSPARFMASSCPVSARPYSDDDLRRVIGSLRRYIYSRFIRPHRRCWNALMRIEEPFELALSSERVCTVCIAYALFVMQIMGVHGINGLRSRRRRSGSAMLLMARTGVTGPKNLALWVYGRFCILWDRISLLAANGSFRIILNPEMFQYWVRAQGFIFTINPDRDNLPLESDWWLIYPDPDALARNAFVNCYGKVVTPDSMVNWHLWDTLSFWAYRSTARCVFQARASPPRGNYKYISV